MFCDELGGMINPATFTWTTKRLATEAGVPPLTPHPAARPTWATLALSSGVHPKVVQERLGPFHQHDHPGSLQPLDRRNGPGGSREGGRADKNRTAVRVKVVAIGLQSGLTATWTDPKSGRNPGGRGGT